jgi:hypothetical protein
MNPKPPKLKMPAALVIAMFRWLVPTITQCHKNAAGDGMAAYKTAILILSQGVRNSPSFRSWMPESSAQGWQATRYGKPSVNVRLHVHGRPTQPLVNQKLIHRYVTLHGTGFQHPCPQWRLPRYQLRTAASPEGDSTYPKGRHDLSERVTRPIRKGDSTYPKGRHDPSERVTRPFRKGRMTYPKG